MGTDRNGTKLRMFISCVIHDLESPRVSWRRFGLSRNDCNEPSGGPLQTDHGHITDAETPTGAPDSILPIAPSVVPWPEFQPPHTLLDLAALAHAHISDTTKPIPR